MNCGMSAFGPKRTSLAAPHMSAFGGKADMTVCGKSLSRSLLGVKRTWLVAAHMSASDPKRTLALNRRMSAFGGKGDYADAAIKRTATWVSIKDMAMCRSWPASLLFVRLHATVQDVRLPTR